MNIYKTIVEQLKLRIPMVVSAQFIFFLLRKLLTKLILHSCQEVMNKHVILML